VSDAGSIVSMSAARYRMLGYVVWQGGRWYLRKRLPGARRAALVSVAATGGLIGATLLAKRLSG
jgi:hypothetical protein